MPICIICIPILDNFSRFKQDFGASDVLPFCLSPAKSSRFLCADGVFWRIFAMVIRGIALTFDVPTLEKSKRTVDKFICI